MGCGSGSRRYFHRPSRADTAIRGAGRSMTAPRWQSRRDARLADRPRRRAVGAGARYRLVFTDRLLANAGPSAPRGHP